MHGQYVFKLDLADYMLNVGSKFCYSSIQNSRPVIAPFNNTDHIVLFYFIIMYFAILGYMFIDYCFLFLATILQTSGSK